MHAQSLTNFVNPLIGTKGLFLYGRTTPFVTPPFGMTQWTACTRNSKIRIPNYHYFDTRIRGFRASHKPAMWMGDYGYVTLKPVTGVVNRKALNRTYFFSHFAEKSKPHYYSVNMLTPALKKIKTEMTSTARCGMLKFEFAKNQIPSVLIEASQLPDFDGWIKVDTAKQEVTGWNSDRHSSHLGPPLPNFKGYFVIKFDQAALSYGTWNNDTLTTGSTSQTANACGAWISFAKGTRSVQATVATSFISIEQARENLEKEVGAKSFAQVEKQTQTEWDNYLSRLTIDGARTKRKKVFYSAMYHTMLFPRQFSEYGKYYSAFDDKVHTGVSYNDYSLWDTYRAEHPLLILTAPEHMAGMVNSLIQMYEEGGYMPKWPNPTYTGIMIGTHADAVVADAIVKGVKGINLQKAYEACMKDAMVPSGNDSVNRWADRAPFTYIEARNGLSWYMKLGYVPVDKTNESVSNTLEGAYDDFCVAQVAKAAGHLADYDMLMKRSKNYVNVYNAATGMMAPRRADGSWHDDVKAGFTEGSPWTYLFGVQHDVPGLINLMGGKEAFIKKLKQNFRGVHYIHMNEPGHHYTYLYDYVGEAWRTQKLVALNRRFLYRNNPDGMDGDDDCGQMSAWYVFSALGFYPVTPGTDVYAIGTPEFPKSTIYFDPTNRERKFEIIANKVSVRNKYIQSVTLNGKKLDSPFLKHGDIINGGKLEFEMGARPVKNNW
ncbi:MAG TPA: GH92 family glycosyl hydrolase [Chitinophagales bacterium]|nr:GH92 family glycosyl hydrolase [Chitinophagales bacterium]